MVIKIVVLIQTKDEIAAFDEALKDILEKDVELFFIHTKKEAAILLEKENPHLLLLDGHFTKEGLTPAKIPIIELKRPLNMRHIKEACREHLKLFIPPEKPISM